MKTYLFIFAFCLCGNMASAQSSYNNGFGLRLGGTSGLTFKHHTNSTTAIEGIVHGFYFNRGLSFTALYEKNQTVFDDAAFQFFYGAGGHIGFYQGGIYTARYANGTAYRYSSSYATFGIDGIIGLEYKIPTIPFTASVDLKPTFEIYNPVFGFLDGAFSIRYIF